MNTVKDKESCKMKKTSVGGQAIMEGVMMRGPRNAAMAVRNTDGEIVIEEVKFKVAKDINKILGFPFIRGAVNFIESMILGYKTLSRSAELSGMDLSESEPSRFEKWLTKVTGVQIFDIVMYVAIVLGLGFSILLFTVIPAFTTKGIDILLGGVIGDFKSLVEGLLRLGIFVFYLVLVSGMKDIKRIFEYHGAEHKTIFCYEKQMELTVENVRKNQRFHPRCGTSFLFIVMIVGILVYSLPFITWDNIFLRVLTKLLFLPLIAGISYEIIKIAGRYDNIFTRILSAPGLWIQRITTSEPDDSQIEVAIAALKEVIPENRDDAQW